MRGLFGAESERARSTYKIVIHSPGHKTFSVGMRLFFPNTSRCEKFEPGNYQVTSIIWRFVSLIITRGSMKVENWCGCHLKSVSASLDPKIFTRRPLSAYANLQLQWDSYINQEGSANRFIAHADWWMGVCVCRLFSYSGAARDHSRW